MSNATTTTCISSHRQRHHQCQCRMRWEDRTVVEVCRAPEPQESQRASVERGGKGHRRSEGRRRCVGWAKVTEPIRKGEKVAMGAKGGRGRWEAEKEPLPQLLAYVVFTFMKETSAFFSTIIHFMWAVPNRTTKLGHKTCIGTQQARARWILACRACPCRRSAPAGLLRRSIIVADPIHYTHAACFVIRLSPIRDPFGT